MIIQYSGTAADTEKTTDLISSQVRLHSLNTGRQVRVQTALRMIKQMLFRYGGHIGAYLVLGGVDCTGPHLFTIHAAGSTDRLPYVSMGSGSLAAMATFETGFKPGENRQTNKQTTNNKQTNKQTNKQIEKQMNNQPTSKQTE